MTSCFHIIERIGRIEDDAFKEAFITPIVKKPGLDATSTSSYWPWPISNLSVLSKLLERLVVRQLMEYLSSAALLHFFCARWRHRGRSLASPTASRWCGRS